MRCYELLRGQVWDSLQVTSDFAQENKTKPAAAAVGSACPAVFAPWHSPELIVSRLAWGKALCQVVENKSDLPVLALLYKHSFWDCSEKAGTPGDTEHVGWAWGRAGMESCCSLVSLYVTH